MTKYSTFLRQHLSMASEIANRNFGKVTGSTKPDDNNQVLTATDLEIGKLLVGAVKTNFPNHNIIDEEAGAIDNKSNFTWVIDPIDGTSNFANGVPTYGIMIGILGNSQPIAGGVVLPYFNEMFIAERGVGTFCNGTKISVKEPEKLSRVLVAYGIDGHQENPQITHEESQLLERLILVIRNLRTTNSVFDLMMVVKSGFAACLNRTSKIWDNVAPQIILEEAGAVYTDYWGQPMDYSNPLKKTDQNFTFCTASPNIHKEIINIINA